MYQDLKKPLIILLIGITGLFFSRCTKDRDFAPQVITPTDTTGNVGPSTLLVNELLATGSTLANPDYPALGPGDWIEIYNPGNDTFVMEAGKWAFSDSILPGQADQGTLKKNVSLAPKSYTIVQCDGNDTVLTQIHVPFNLSKGGEAVGLFYLKNDSTYIIVDSHSFGAQTSGTSEGRLPNGTNNWSHPLVPTPGAPNQ